MATVPRDAIAEDRLESEVRAWPVIGSSDLRASWATPFAYKGGRYVAVSGSVAGACVVKVLRWGVNGPTFEAVDPK